jgi:hypothetical protein
MRAASTPAFSRSAAFCKRSKADMRLGGRQPDCHRARRRWRQPDLLPVLIVPAPLVTPRRKIQDKLSVH